MHNADGGKKEWRLCKLDDDQNEYTEMLVRVQGILIKADLIPTTTDMSRCGAQHVTLSSFTELWRRIGPAKTIYISQRAIVTGYGSPSFDRSIRKTEEIYALFERHLPHGTMVDWTPITIADYEAFSASTRLFTKRSDAHTESDQPFGDGVDTTGRLERMKGTDLVHLSDNKVTYLKRTTDKVTKCVAIQGIWL